MSSRQMRQVFADDPNSLGSRARSRRWDRFIATFPDLPEMSLLDLGGTAEYWSQVSVRPRTVHLINLQPPPEDLPSWMRADVADACAIPESVLDDGYDLVYSNSVIEHVGGHRRRQDFARQVASAAPRYWVQTPYRYFPVEPHWVAPMMQFLPLRARAAMGRYWPLSHRRPVDLQDSVESQLDIELIDITQMRHYFPDGALVYERVLGLVKSIVAVRSDA